MTVVRIDIENVFGIEKLSFEPGWVTVIRGANGTGKSSILRAMASCFEGGLRPERLRVGAESGFVRFSLKSGEAIQFRAWIKKKKDGTKEHAQVTEYFNKDGVAMPAAASRIKQLGDALAVDPAKLLACDVTTAAGQKALKQAILDVMPFEVTAADLASVIRRVKDSDAPQPNEIAAQAKAASVLPEPVDLGGLRHARMALEETRRRIGVEANQADSTVQTLRKSVPVEEQPGDTANDLKAAEAELAVLRKTIQIEQEAVRAEAAEERVNAERDYQQRLRAIDKAETAALGDIEKEHATKELDLVEGITVLRQQVVAIQQAEGARKKLAELEEIGKQKHHEYDLFSRAIEMLDEIKAAKLAESPIPGLDAEELSIDGVPWQAVNTARRAGVIAQLCALRAGDLPFMIFDDAEHFDKATWGELKTALVEAGFQVTAAFVSNDSPLTVTTEDAVAA